METATIREVKIITCPHCSSDMVLKHGRFGWYYGCLKYPKCKSSISADRYGEPRGKPINDTELKKLRVETHNYLDLIWKNGIMSRTRVYLNLSKLLDIPYKDCHISKFGKETCLKVIDLVKAGKI